MSDTGQEKFEEGFQAAIAASLSGVRASDSLKARLLKSLQEETVTPLPEGVDERSVSDFEKRLIEAVGDSSEWAPEDDLVARTESRLSQELKRDVLSERAVHSLVAKGSWGRANPSKIRYIQGLEGAVTRGLSEVKAPQAVRDSVVKALEKEAKGSKVVSIFGKKKSGEGVSPWRSRWKRAMGTGFSVAAGFAIVFATFFTGADAAIASNVQRDHGHCAKAATREATVPKVGFTEQVQERFGEVPSPPVSEGWTLKVTKVCPHEDGRPMVHYVYARPGKQGNVETISFHFIPPAQDSKGMKVGPPEKVRDLQDGEFPVVAWEQGYWICAACSPDLSAEELKAQLSGLN